MIREESQKMANKMKMKRRFEKINEWNNGAINAIN